MHAYACQAAAAQHATNGLYHSMPSGVNALLADTLCMHVRAKRRARQGKGLGGREGARSHAALRVEVAMRKAADSKREVAQQQRCATQSQGAGVLHVTPPGVERPSAPAPPPPQPHAVPHASSCAAPIFEIRTLPARVLRTRRRTCLHAMPHAVRSGNSSCAAARMHACTTAMRACCLAWQHCSHTHTGCRSALALWHPPACPCFYP